VRSRSSSPSSDALILASGSPQRRAILEQLGVPFSVLATGVEELEQGEPREVALENARRKARAAQAALAEQGEDGGVPAPVLGVDTLVALDQAIYGKPADEEQARATLRALDGREHSVISGVCVIAQGFEQTAAALTTVRFRPLDEATIGWYVASGEWRERAGGYAIQGRGAALVAAISGDYTNVVGLPVATLLEILPKLLFPAISRA